MTIPTPFREAFPDGPDDAAYRRMMRDQLTVATKKVRGGICVHPPCTLAPKEPGDLTCGAWDCLDWLEAFATDAIVAHWRNIQERREGPTPNWRSFFLAGIFGGAGFGVVVAAAFAVGIWFRWLRIVA